MTAASLVADAGAETMPLQSLLLLLLALHVIHSVLASDCIPECICLSQTQVCEFDLGVVQHGCRFMPLYCTDIVVIVKTNENGCNGGSGACPESMFGDVGF